MKPLVSSSQLYTSPPYHAHFIGTAPLSMISFFFFHGSIRSDDLLHPARSRVSLVIHSVLTDVHFVMLLLYDVFGLPRLRFPLTFPWITHFTSSHPPSLMVCLKKVSLRRTTNPRSCLVVPNSVRMLSSVLCSGQLTRNIRR